MLGIIQLVTWDKSLVLSTDAKLLHKNLTLGAIIVVALLLALMLSTW